MDELDRQIEEALGAQDRGLMEQFGEQGLWAQLGGLFQGKLAWLTAITLLVGTIATVIGFYAIWKFVTVDDVREMLLWGGVVWAGFTTQMMIKLWSWMRMESNRVIREVKRMELQLARLQAK